MSVELGAIGSWSTSPRPSDPGACSPDGRSKLIPTPPQSRCDQSFGNREPAPLSALPMQVTGGPGRFSSFGIGVKRRAGVDPGPVRLAMRLCASRERRASTPPEQIPKPEHDDDRTDRAKSGDDVIDRRYEVVRRTT